jgi:hypothetical protein
VLIFVASRGIPTRGRGVKHAEIFVGTILLFRFGKNAFGMRLGPLGLGWDLWACVGVSHPQKEI